MAAPTQHHQTGVVDLGALLDAGEGAVVTLVAGETRLAVHRAVLSATSPMFAAMFGHDTLEASTGEVDIQDMEGPVLRQLVAHLYTGRVPQLPGMAPRLLTAADRYGLLVLKDACEQQLVAQLDLKSVAAAAVLAVRHSCPTLREAAVNFVRVHSLQVMATKGWAEAVRRQPEDVVEFTRLLAPPDTSDVATADSMGTPSPAATTTTTAAANRRHRRHRHRPATAAAPAATVAPDAPTAVPTAAPSATPAAAAHSVERSRNRRTPATVPQATARYQTPPPDDAAVSRFRGLSGEEKSRRLIQAAVEGAVEEMRALIAAGADVGAVNWMGWTALHHAAESGHLEAARSLLGAGAAVGARERWWQGTPLHYGALRGHAAVVRLLLAASADPNARDVGGWTPLHGAAYYGQAEAAAALLEGGADRRARSNRGRTALDVARQRNYRQLVHLLE